MNRNILTVVGITILFLGTCIIPTVAIDNAKKLSMLISNGNTLYVGGNGPNNYTKIQYAIDNASDGDTVFVYNRTYCEQIVIGKKLNIIGRSQKDTIICAIDESNYIIRLGMMGRGTTITGFTILSDKISYYGGILMTGSWENTIENNIFIIPKDMGSSSIEIRSGSNYNIIKNNTILGHGIKIEESNNNIVMENDIIEAFRDGIGLERAHFNIIEGNKIYNCNSLSIGESNNNIVTCNNFIGNIRGVGISSSKENKIIGNNFENNGYGAHIFWCGYNYIYKNNFKDNHKNAYVVGNWRRPLNSWKENYWDDWIGLSNPLLFWIPKFIEGEIMLNPEKSINCFNFDLCPAKEPYDI